MLLASTLGLIRVLGSADSFCAVRFMHVGLALFQRRVCGASWCWPASRHAWARDKRGSQRDATLVRNTYSTLPQMPEEAELMWDDGSKHPEFTLDNPAPSLTPVRCAPSLHSLLGRCSASLRQPESIFITRLTQCAGTGSSVARYGVRCFRPRRICR